MGRSFRRPARPDRPTHLLIGLPTPDGAGWPDPEAVGRPSFEASTFAEMALRHAYDPEAHAVADRLAHDVLPRVPTGVSAQDEPYLHQVFTTAARIGVGLAVVERTLPPAEPSGALPADAPAAIDRHLAGALWLARRRLPALQPGWSQLAGYFLLAGFHLARSGPEVVDRLAAELGPPAAG